MITSVMREQLIAYLTNADDKKIIGLFSILEENIQDAGLNTLTDKELSFLKEERQKHLSGQSKAYNWEEVKSMIRNKAETMLTLKSDLTVKAILRNSNKTLIHGTCFIL